MLGWAVLYLIATAFGDASLMRQARIRLMACGERERRHRITARQTAAVKSKVVQNEDHQSGTQGLEAMCS